MEIRFYSKSFFSNAVPDFFFTTSSNFYLLETEREGDKSNAIAAASVLSNNLIMNTNFIS